MIVKVQLSIATNAPKQMVLVYNKSRSVLVEEEATKEIQKLMGADLKKFFKASKTGSQLKIEQEVAYQNW